MLMYDLQIPSMGLLNTVGVLQAWVSEHQLHGYSESSIGWIFSAYAFFLYIGGAQVGEYLSPELVHPSSMPMISGTSLCQAALASLLQSCA
jgi:hypothetical protein